MTDYEGSQSDARMQGTSGAKMQAEVVDLLIRNLELAKANFEGGEAGLVLPDQICTLLYAASGTFCPLLYIHGHLTEEAEPVG